VTLPASYLFPGSAGPLPDPPWIMPGPGALQLRGDGTTDVDPVGTNVCIAMWDADVFPDDQVHSVVIAGTLPADDSVELGLICRSDGGSFSGGTFYLAYTDGGSHTRLEKWVAGVETDLASADSQVVASGDVLEFECSGAIQTVRLNGTPIMVAADTSILAGQPGLYSISLVGQGVAGLSDWNGDGSGGSTPGTHVLTGRGNTAIDGPAWLSTSITGRPSSLGNGEAEPTDWFHMGSISWGTDNGAMTRYIVKRELDLVQVPAGMTTLWYEFPAGVTATIVELSAP
jgi:hypothetical protein